jgi:hypothetical protein
MVSLVMVFHVADYDRWRAGSDGFFRTAGDEGVLRQTVYRAVDDPNEIMLALELRGRADAERIMQRREDLRASLEAAQITIYPAAFVGEKAEEIEY